ncbi:hypothetical protein JOC77_002011 [Peribacillus deserti]|uniref:Carbon starvation protein A n=1 Tax=Peribacillus deserti TaxID=673318 RepID=A0ABS2QHD6_9BACI|nr:hypothetical protein [Peribacillus deserti]
MIWLFVIATICTYSLVMKYVLNRIQKPFHPRETQSITTENNKGAFIAAHSAR